MSIQEALRLLRMELGLTQSDLADKLNKAYVTVNRWENGKGFPSRNNAKDILDFAKKYNASDECITYLYKVLLPGTKRSISALVYGFPEIDKEFLFQLADDSANLVYVIEEGTYRLLYVNRTAKEAAESYKAVNTSDYKPENLSGNLQIRCFDFFTKTNVPCQFCPLKKATEKNDNFIVSIPNSKMKYKVHIKKGQINGKTVYAVYATDITQEDIERNAIYNLMNDIPDGVGVYNVYFDGRVELAFMNNTYSKMIGEDNGDSLFSDELSGFSLIHPEDVGKVLNIISNNHLKNSNQDFFIRAKLKDKEYHKIHITTKIIKRDVEKYTYYCLFHEVHKK